MQPSQYTGYESDWHSEQKLDQTAFVLESAVFHKLNVLLISTARTFRKMDTRHISLIDLSYSAF